MINPVTLKFGDVIYHITLNLSDMINIVTHLQSDFTIVQVTQKFGDIINHVTLKLSTVIDPVECCHRSRHSESRVT